MPWVSGKSGNPGGRPKELASIQKMARDEAETAIKALVKVATSGKSESARVAAATQLLDRGFGRPPQMVTDDANEMLRVISAEPMTADEWEHRYGDGAGLGATAATAGKH